MIGAPQTSSLVTFSKDLVADQTWSGFTGKFGAPAFSPGVGLGSGAAATTSVICNVGGFAAQRITAVIKFVAPTAAGGEDFGILARYGNLDVAGNYYYARCFHGAAFLQKIANGAFTTLQTLAFALPQNTPVTIVTECIGTSIKATFTAAGPGTVTLNGVDATFASGGAAFTSINPSTVYCSSFLVEQLQ
jgi:hypothetical protein